MQDADNSLELLRFNWNVALDQFFPVWYVALSLGPPCLQTTMPKGYSYLHPPYCKVLSYWLRHPCRLGGPQRLRVGGKISTGPQASGLAISPLPSWGVPNAPEQETKSEGAHKWADWLPHPCRLGGPQRFTEGDKTSSGPQLGKLAIAPLLLRGFPAPQCGRQNHVWHTTGQFRSVTPAV